MTFRFIYPFRIKITFRFELISVKKSHFALKKNHNSYRGLQIITFRFEACIPTSKVVYEELKQMIRNLDRFLQKRVTANRCKMGFTLKQKYTKKAP